MLTRLHAFALAGMSAVAFGCGTVPSGYSPVTEHDVDAGRFRVSTPPGDGWGVQVEPPTKVRFARRESSLGRPTGVFEILVAEAAASPEAPTDPAAVAADFMTREADGMRAAGDKVLKLRRTEEKFGERRVYRMLYRVNTSDGLQYRILDGALHLWFPDEFPSDRHFFLVLITGWRESGSADAEFDAVRPILAGIRRAPAEGAVAPSAAPADPAQGASGSAP